LSIFPNDSAFTPDPITEEKLAKLREAAAIPQEIRPMERTAADQQVLDSIHSRLLALVIYLEGNSQVPPYVISESEDIDREIYAQLR